ncbi:response regulator transcription factor [Streptomyces sp. CA-210063]|uniref:winged helix-turn-helix transcriptional regulator n=1 Tax=Streptomyces sp. CA-210063 TaxID=2801029 RepID=UPI00214BE323|nr:response regulator transcription factor [Streptomyces sp. CA-210063]UUU30171.1 response regulator transcription factor [Streptomyces sp. CA-210063]
MDTPPTSVSDGDGTTRVLVAHGKLSQALRLYRHLRSAGMSVALPRGGVGALGQLQEQPPDVVLLAVAPSEASWNPMALARALRQQPERPGILFLTSGPCRAEELSLADDYAHEDCLPDELALRIQVLLSRRSAPGSPPGPASGLQILPESRRVLRHGREVPLTATEFDILRLLATHPGQVVPKGEILDHVWHHDFNGESNIVEAYICTLRRKLADSDRSLISTVRGVGYLLAAPEPAPAPAPAPESLNPSLRITVPAAAEVVITSPTA